MSRQENLFTGALLRGVETFLRAAPGGAAVRGEAESSWATLPRNDALPAFRRADQEQADHEQEALLDLAARCALGPSAPTGAGAARLRSSPFARVRLSDAAPRLPSTCMLRPTRLSTQREAAFPLPGENRGNGDFEALLRGFREDWPRIRTPDELLALLEVYLHAVPHPERKEIGLFDHTRLTAALAICFRDALDQGPWQGREPGRLNSETDTLPAPCLLVSGDLSGIQHFIFGVPSEGASRALKGQSWEVQLLTEACARRLLDALGLPEACLLYNGGGNFFLLAPAHHAEQLKAQRQEIMRELLPTELYLALGWAEVGVADLLAGRFATCWKEANRETERLKARRFQELSADVVFAPFPQNRTRDDYAEQTRKLAEAVGYALVPRGSSSSPLARIGYGTRFMTGEDRDARAFNTTDFAGRFAGFRFAVKDLPHYDDALLEQLYPPSARKWRPDEVRAGGLIDFDHLAGMAEARTGTRKLGVLKMDVDNLGRLFVEGLPERERGIAQIAALSRSLAWFFEAYVGTLIGERTFAWLPAAGASEAPEQQPFRTQLYPVFSGGDDLFVVGAWDAVWEFALLLRSEFAEFACHNPDVTLSAALLIVDPKFSVARFAAEAEHRLEVAKQRDARKNRVNVLDEVLTWDEFRDTARLKQQLEVLVKRRGESRGLLERVRRSAIGYGRLQEHALGGRIRPEKIWRLAYFLARNAKRENQDEIRRIADLHQELLLDAFANPAAARNPALFGVAARWAELSSRRNLHPEPTPVRTHA